jgi:hypothetical protein
MIPSSTQNPMPENKQPEVKANVQLTDEQKKAAADKAAQGGSKS